MRTIKELKKNLDVINDTSEVRKPQYKPAMYTTCDSNTLEHQMLF